MLGTCRRGGGQGCSAIAGHVSCEARGRVGRLMDGGSKGCAPKGTRALVKLRSGVC